MTNYTIEEERGVFIVTEMQPRIIGQFMDPSHARMFVAALEQKFRPVEGKVEAPEPGQAADPEPVARMTAPVAARKPVPPAAEVRAVPLRSEKELEADYHHALARIEAGEGCKDVADDMDLPFGKLRSRRALQVQAQKADTAARPDKVARKVRLWDTDMDLELMDCRDDQAALEAIAKRDGRTVAQCKARIDVLLREAQKMMEG